MKKLLLLLFCSNPWFLFGQVEHNPNTYNHVFKISPAQFAISYFEFSYEYFFNNRKSSLQISPMIMLKDNRRENFKGLSGELQYRVYLKHLNNEEEKIWIFSNISFYTGAYGLGTKYSEEYQRGVYDPYRDIYEELEFTKDITAFEGGVFVGAQFAISKRLVLDFTVGGGIRYNELTDTFDDADIDDYWESYNVFDIEYIGVKPKLNLQLGITL